MFLPGHADQYRRREPEALYGCKNWQQCVSRRPSPPYNPKQPKKCETHRTYMRTLIEDDRR